MSFLIKAPSWCASDVVMGLTGGLRDSGDKTPYRMTGVTLHSHVHYKEI